MPIIKDERGNVQLQFGAGDIDASPALLEYHEVCGAVCFFQRENENEIGAHVDYEPNRRVEPEYIPVRMSFDKIESIDVVIWALEEAKKMMLDKGGSLNE